MFNCWRKQVIKGSKKEKGPNINRDITAPRVRLIDAEGEQAGIVSLDEAIDKATEAGLDLVEISPDAEPPVCRVMDYGKFQFQRNKQKAQAKKNQKRMQVKEVKLRPGTDVNDYNVKLRNLIRFLDAGNKAKVSLRFRGREMAHQELGMEMMNRLRADLEECATVEHEPKLEGRQMIMILAPKKKK